MPASWLPDWETLSSFTASFMCKCQRTQRSTTPEGPFMKRTIHLLLNEWSDGSSLCQSSGTEILMVTMVTEWTLCKTSATRLFLKGNLHPEAHYVCLYLNIGDVLSDSGSGLVLYFHSSCEKLVLVFHSDFMGGGVIAKAFTISEKTRVNLEHKW